jgi:hypothetical protein
VTIVDERGRWLADPFALPVAPAAPVEVHKLSQKAIREATELLLPHWKRGRRHWLALYLAGACARSGYTQDQAAHLVHTIAERAKDNELDDRLRAVATTYKRLHEGGTIIGWGGLRQLLGDTADRLRALLAPEPTYPHPRSGPRALSGGAQLLAARTGALRARMGVAGVGLEALAAGCRRRTDA